MNGTEIIKRLKAEGWSGPRRHFESIAQRCIHLLNQFGTYMAMTPWLKVEG